MKIHHILFGTLLIMLLCVSCSWREYYMFPHKDFGVTIPISVPNYYDIDTVDCGFGSCPNRVLVLQLTPDEFHQYMGHIDFEPIDTRMIIRDTIKNIDILELREFYVDTLTNTSKIRSIRKLNQENLHQDFDFKNGKICFFKGSIWRIALYDSKKGILIFSSSF